MVLGPLGMLVVPVPIVLALELVPVLLLVLEPSRARSLWPASGGRRV
jgi:hypothetical protein